MTGDHPGVDRESLPERIVATEHDLKLRALERCIVRGGRGYIDTQGHRLAYPSHQ
jgi:hypothetical protein